MVERKEEEKWKEGYPVFVYANRGCCDKLTVIQSDTYSNDETMSGQAKPDKNNHPTY